MDPDLEQEDERMRLLFNSPERKKLFEETGRTGGTS
jgi:hypothetical protein